MKNKSTLTVLILALFAMSTIFSSCNNENSTEKVTLHISPMMCETMLYGLTPEEFCETKGNNTFLEKQYLQAEVDKDGCLIITLRNEVVSKWKDTFLNLQVLQCVLGDTLDIGITIDYSRDYMDYMENAHTCGYEISEDFTQIIESPEDNSWYFPVITLACATMQVFEGKDCSEVKVEYVYIDDNGEIIDKIIFPNDSKNFSNITS